jgi:predicted permease
VSAGPPRIAERLLQRLVRGTLGGDAILGDLAEEHAAQLHARGRAGAAAWYWRQALGMGGRLLFAGGRPRRPAPSPFALPGDPLMSGLWRDFRLALRLLAHQPAFAAIVIVTLAVGLAANATVIALIDGLVLRPFPLRDIDRLVQVYGTGPESGPLANRREVSPADFVDFQREARSAELIALEWWDATFSGSGEPERLQGFRVSPAFFDAMGVGVGAGRGFRAEEGQAGRDRVAVISDALWHRRFGGDPAILGTTVPIDGEPFQIVGVAPSKFDYPYGSQVWVPLAVAPDALERRQSRYLSVIGRLRGSATPAQLQAELTATAARLAQQFPLTNRGWGVNTMPLAESVVDFASEAFLAVQQIATLLVLLLACANVANLLIVRGADRSKELAMRLALGASRWRVIRLLLLESLTLALAGAAGAIPLAWAALQACRAAMPPSVARFVRGWNELDIDGRVVAALAVLAVACVVIFGLLPALRTTRVSLNDTLKAGGRGGDGGGHRLRHAMVVIEVALALTLLVAAGLSVRGTTRVLFRDDGYNPESVMTLRISLIGPAYETAETQRAFFERLADDARGAVGIDGVALVNVAPGSPRNHGAAVEIEGRPVEDAAQRRHADLRRITPGYLRTLDIRLRSGRDFTAADRPDTLPVAIVSETMARRYWNGADPIGRRFRVEAPDAPWRTVVGVAGDVHHTWFEPEMTPTFYVPFAQDPAADMVLALRSTGDPSPLATAGRQLVWRRDAAQPVYEVRSLRQVRSEAAVGLQFAAAFMGVFGLIGLLLAGVGIYAIMAYAVRQRTREIGLRMALGAQPRAVLASTLGRGLRLTAIGLGVGLAGAYALGSAMEQTLFGTVEVDALTFVVFTALLAIAAVAASIVPARRALRVDPMVALRQ